MAASEQLQSGAAGRYASALFELAGESKQSAAVGESLQVFQRLLDESPELTGMVRSPLVKADQQLASVEALAEKAQIGGLTLNFLKLIAKNRRLSLVSEMIRAFAALQAKAKGEILAEVTSAEELSAHQVKELKAALKASLGQDALLTQRVDPSILGGLVVKAGSRMLDNSLRTKLANLKVAMKGNA